MATTWLPTNVASQQGLLYLWSPLIIFCVALAAFIGVLLLIGVVVMIYNYCTYGTCCCPTGAPINWCCNGCANGLGSACTASPCLCCQPPAAPASEEPVKVIRRRRSSCGSEVSGGGDGDNVSRCSSRSKASNVLVLQPDRKVVRIAETASIRSQGPVAPDIILIQDPPRPPQPPPMMMMMPPPQQPPTVQCYQPPPCRPAAPNIRDLNLRVTIGNGPQPQRMGSNQLVFPWNQQPTRSQVVYAPPNQTSNVSMQFQGNQSNEYVLTSVGGQGNGGGSGFNGGGGFSGGGGFNNGGFSGGGFNNGGFGGGGFNNGGFGGGGGGFGNGFSSQENVCLPSGQQSAVIDIGGGGFYPSLPTNYN